MSSGKITTFKNLQLLSSCMEQKLEHYNVVYGLNSGLSVIAHDAYKAAVSTGTVRHTNLGDFYSAVPQGELAERIFEILKTESGQEEDKPCKISSIFMDLEARFLLAESYDGLSDADKAYVVREQSGAGIVVPRYIQEDDGILGADCYAELSTVFLPQIYDAASGGTYLQTVEEIRRQQAAFYQGSVEVNANLEEIQRTLARMDARDSAGVPNRGHGDDPHPGVKDIRLHLS